MSGEARTGSGRRFRRGRAMRAIVPHRTSPLPAVIAPRCPLGRSPGPGDATADATDDAGRYRPSPTQGSITVATSTTDVLVAGYRDIESATADFDALVEGVKAKAIRIEAAILVSRDTDGEVVVQQTGDHLGRK